MLTRGKFLELLKAMDPDPAFLTLIIKECFSSLPDAVAWKLAHQLYINYYWDGEVYKIKSNLSGEELMFSSSKDVTIYLNKLGYNVTESKVNNAFRDRRVDWCNHQFMRDIKEEITYFE